MDNHACKTAVIQFFRQPGPAFDIAKIHYAVVNSTNKSFMIIHRTPSRAEKTMLSLCLFRALINSIVRCFCTSALGLTLFQIVTIHSEANMYIHVCICVLVC